MAVNLALYKHWLLSDEDLSFKIQLWIKTFDFYLLFYIVATLYKLKATQKIAKVRFSKKRLELRGYKRSLK